MTFRTGGRPGRLRTGLTVRTMPVFLLRPYYRPFFQSRHCYSDYGAARRRSFLLAQSPYILFISIDTCTRPYYDTFTTNPAPDPSPLTQFAAEAAHFPTTIMVIISNNNSGGPSPARYLFALFATNNDRWPSTKMDNNIDGEPT